MSPSTPPDGEPQGSETRGESPDVEALSPTELAELYARAGGQPPPDPARVKEVAEVKAVLELLTVALGKDSGLEARLQEQILAVICEIEAKLADRLSGAGGPDMGAVKRLLAQLVQVIEQTRKTAKPCEPVSLESQIMAEIAGPETPEPESNEESSAPASADPAMDALYQSLRASEPPLLEQTAAGDIEVVHEERPPEDLPKFLTEPWDAGAEGKSAPETAAAGEGAKGGLFKPLGRLFKKTPAKPAT